MDGMKETAVKMRYIVEEMGYHMPEGFFGHHVFLPALVAVAALNSGAAIEAIFFLPEGNM